MSGSAFASGSSVSKKKMMKKRMGTGSETSNATDDGRASPSALNEIVVGSPTAEDIKAF